MRQFTNVKVLAGILLTMTLCSFAEARTWSSATYNMDPNRDHHHVFGEFAPAPSYADPEFAEGARMASPLYNPMYFSYDVIVVINKSDIHGSDGQLLERGQRMRVYIRQEAYDSLNRRNMQNVKPDAQSGLLYYWKVSTARPGKDTPAGHFTVQSFSSRHASSIYNNAPMPNAIFFNGNIASHGVLQSYYPKLGSRASAGCVRLETQRAEDLFHLIGHVGMGQVDVLKKDGSPAGKGQRYKTLYIIRN